VGNTYQRRDAHQPRFAPNLANHLLEPLFAEHGLLNHVQGFEDIRGCVFVHAPARESSHTRLHHRREASALIVKAKKVSVGVWAISGMWNVERGKGPYHRRFQLENIPRGGFVRERVVFRAKQLRDLSRDHSV
jgi:hypothetical protein